mmetsp:Transcript_19558/g.77938  ORF Transcript_19558/g.77938 Transcript_19558/m.77938 type:complete len:115 (-) Transcript_19558:63-407(-)
MALYCSQLRICNYLAQKSSGLDIMDPSTFYRGLVVVAYQLELPGDLQAHDVFQVSLLRKFNSNLILRALLVFQVCLGFCHLSKTTSNPCFGETDMVMRLVRLVQLQSKLVCTLD